jgi:hypothetical protein
MRTILYTACAVLMLGALVFCVYGYFLFLCIKGER